MKLILQLTAVFCVYFFFNCTSVNAAPPKALQWNMLDWVSDATEERSSPAQEKNEAAFVEEAAKTAEEPVVGVAEITSRKQPVPPTNKPGLALIVSGPPEIDLVGGAFTPDGKADSVIRVAVKEPGLSVVSLRIDNLGGQRVHWQSDSAAGALPMAVYHKGVLLNHNGNAFSLSGTSGDNEQQVFAVTVQDNGVIEASTKLRLTIFLNDKQRRYANIEMDAKGE